MSAKTKQEMVQVRVLEKAETSSLTTTTTWTFRKEQLKIGHFLTLPYNPQVKQEPRDDSAYVFDETDHVPKRPCLSNMSL